MPRFPVDPPQLVRVPPPAALARWQTGELVGDAKHALVVRVRPGYVKRDYAVTTRLDTGQELLMQTIVGSAHQYPPWVGTWTPVGPWRTLPNIQSSKWARSFDQNGSSTETVVMDNIIFEEQTGVAGIFHDIKRGFFSPSRGVVLASRPSLWDDTGWTNALNGGYQIEVWEGYGSGDEIVPLDAPDPVTNSCAPPGGAISRTWTGVIEQVDLTSHPDHITLTARDFGILFTDQRLQSTNKAAEIVAPTTFADQSHSMGIRPTGLRPTLKNPFFIQWFDTFAENHLDQYAQATGELAIGSELNVGPTHSGVLKPNVWMQGGLISIRAAGSAGLIVKLPGCFTYHNTGAIASIFDGDGNPVPAFVRPDPFETFIYWNNETGVLSIGKGITDPTTGDFVWDFIVPVGTTNPEAVQPILTLLPGSYVDLTVISDTPLTLPGDSLNTADAPHAVTTASFAPTSSYEGASGKSYDDSQLWFSAIQGDPAMRQHVDVGFSRIWPVPSIWNEGTASAMNEQAVLGGIAEALDQNAVGPAALRDIGVLSAALTPRIGTVSEFFGGPGIGPPGPVGKIPVLPLDDPLAAGTTITVANQFEPQFNQAFVTSAAAAVGAKVIHVDTIDIIENWGPGAIVLLGTVTTELPMTPVVPVVDGRHVVVIDPTGEFKQLFTTSKANDSLTGLGVVAALPDYSFPAGSTVATLSTAPAHSGIGQFRLFTMTPLVSGCEMWVSLHMDNTDATMDGKPIPEGWVDLNLGNTPEGVPFLLHTVLDFDAPGPLTFDLGHVFDTGHLWNLHEDGSTDGQVLSTDAIPGVTLRFTFSSLQTGVVSPPKAAYMTVGDRTALDAALTAGHYIVGMQDVGLFGFYPWEPGQANPVGKLTADLSNTPKMTTKLKTTPLLVEVPAGARVTVSASADQATTGGSADFPPITSWDFIVKTTAIVGAAEIDVVPQALPSGSFEWQIDPDTELEVFVQTASAVEIIAGASVQLDEDFLTVPPASLGSGCGTLAEIDSYPDGALVAGLVNAVHWVMVNDASEVVEVLCKWAGFKEWNLQWFGWSLINPMQYGSDKFFIDIVNDILSQGNFVFYMDGPTDNDASIGVPCFVQQSAAGAPPADIIEVTDQNLLETAEVKWDLSSLPSVLRYRGNPVPEGDEGQTYEEDLVATFMATYFPPWAGDDYHPLDGTAPPDPPLRRTAGVVRHFTQTVGVNVPIGMNSNEQCLFACLLAAMQYAIAMGTGQVQVPGLDGFSLNQQISVVDEADGINSRMWLASVESDHSMGPTGKWLMVLGGSYLDTEDMDLLLEDYDYALTQVRPQQPTGEQYVGVPSVSVAGWEVSTGKEQSSTPLLGP